jgi:hypothetical protein
MQFKLLAADGMAKRRFGITLCLGTRIHIGAEAAPARRRGQAPAAGTGETL